MTTLFHRVWLGSNPIPERYEIYWEAWQRQYPQCEFRTWRDEDLDELILTRDIILGLNRYITSRADIASYEIMYHHGGIYLDCDMMPYNYFDPEEMTRQLTVCNEDENTNYCSVGFIGAPPQHPVFRDIIAHVLGHPIDENEAPNISTGPWLFGSFLRHHQFKRLPTRAFYPYGPSRPISYINRADLSETYGIHVWGGAWIDAEMTRGRALSYIKCGDIVESAQILAKHQDQTSEDFRALIDTIRNLRQCAAQCAGVLHPDMTIAPADRPVFELPKVARWLLERDPDLMIWQIGAADGILVDPLRSTMVNHDPNAVLLEPNPYMYERLTQNYAKNRKAKLLQRAYALDDRPLVLNAINPEKANALGLPCWVMGISSVYGDKNALGGKTIDALTTQRIQSCVERIEVPTVPFEGLLVESGNVLPEILVVDAEGMDSAIIADIFAHGARPAVVHFEVQCLEEAERKALENMLEEQYVLVQSGNDVTAYRQDMLFEYVDALYIDHGIPTMLSTGLVKLNGLWAA